jgi:alpha-galactosidase/6-phospho-beta-glucosidase family protein
MKHFLFGCILIAAILFTSCEPQTYQYQYRARMIDSTNAGVITNFDSDNVYEIGDTVIDDEQGIRSVILDTIPISHKK